MTPTKNLNYEFGGFSLHPRNRLLDHFDRPVELSGKDFDVLLYLVENANKLVRKGELIDAVWGAGAAIHAGNLTHHIAKIRRTLGCDPQRPTFIRTLRGGNGGYRFIAQVIPSERDGEEFAPESDRVASAPHVIKTEPFEIASHVFVPVYLGPGLYSELEGLAKETQWIKYKEHKTETGRLCVLPTGVAVWHLRHAGSFPSLTDVAIWRKRLYDEIFGGKHALRKDGNQLLKRFPPKDELPFRAVLGKPGYAYSVMTLRSPKWKNPDKIRKVIEVLACPKTLEPEDGAKSERDRLRRLERQFLEHGLNGLDMREFGLNGSDLGFASWEGLSYWNSSSQPHGAIQTLVEFQIAMHALWWYSKCFSDLWWANPQTALKQLKKLIPEIKKQFLVLKNIEAKESTSQRTMVEAVIEMNRVGQTVAETMELYD